MRALTRQVCRCHERISPPAEPVQRIEGGQKAGVVGRTGAGKSSLVLALFRLVEASGGKIEIDGVDVSQIGLGRMRNAVTIIPQDPTLHKGSVAHNLDPFGGHSEAEMLQVLIRTQLPESMLYTEVEKAGSNLSSGERQLLCFARALLRRRPILVNCERSQRLSCTLALQVRTPDGGSLTPCH